MDAATQLTLEEVAGQLDGNDLSRLLLDDEERCAVEQETVAGGQCLVAKVHRADLTGPDVDAEELPVSVWTLMR